MKQTKRIFALFLTLCVLFGGMVTTGRNVEAATTLPNELFLRQEQRGTCTLCSSAMMLRSRAYLSGNGYWSSITESGIRSKAWMQGVGLYWDWSYSIGDCSFTVSRKGLSGISVSSLKAVLDSHPEGIVLYCKSVPHAVFLIDYEGDTFYCADTTTNHGGQRIPLSSSYLGSQLGSQARILNNVSAYWYIASYTAPSHVQQPQPDPTGLPFVDIYTTDWYFSAVKHVYESNIMTGMSETVFGPVDSLSRAQFAVMLHRLEGTPAAAYTDKFADVPAGMWYTDAIMWANEKGIITGYAEGDFGTDDLITREQMATILHRYAVYKGCDVSSVTSIDTYLDASHVSPFAKGAMEWAAGSAIITGKDNATRLAPLENTARAECAVIFKRFMEKYN